MLKIQVHIKLSGSYTNAGTFEALRVIYVHICELCYSDILSLFLLLHYLRMQVI